MKSMIVRTMDVMSVIVTRNGVNFSQSDKPSESIGVVGVEKAKTTIIMAQNERQLIANAAK
jgi:hypothetical protein